ncbi:MAG TPA: aminotransferase class I/II-fold pyridoxal phosphate-dependent enzyme, partial [Candidatus Binatia bacterium]|nr:aminotransferase class I/II-fold pyridoxal phosphate-dependent enzyme [Candidatus Binatia bacterium]
MTLERVLDFSANINPLGWPPAAARAYHHARRRIVHYPEPYTESLTRALAAYHDLDPSIILVGNGSTQLIFLLARTLAARRVLLVEPLFGEYETAFRLSSSRIRRFFYDRQLLPCLWSVSASFLTTVTTHLSSRTLIAQ